MSFISKIAVPGVNDPYDIQASQALSLPLGETNSNSTATSFTATISGITALTDGTSFYLTNTKTNSTSQWTLNVNSLGAKPVYINIDKVRSYTDFHLNDTYLFVYSSTLVNGGCWIMMLDNAPLVFTFTTPQLQWKLRQMTNTTNAIITPVDYTLKEVMDAMEAVRTAHRQMYIRIRDIDNSNQSVTLPFTAYLNSTYYFSITEQFWGDDTSLTDVGLVNINCKFYVDSSSNPASELEIFSAYNAVVPSYYEGTKIATIYGKEIFVPWTDGDSQGYGGGS